MTPPVSTSRKDLQAIARRAMQERGLLAEFSAAAQAETDAITGPAVEAGPGIRDLRALLWCSIDNDESRDLDQLSVAEPGQDGAVKILVAIADVDASVRKGSAIDAHARTNTTSVYTAAGIFPMLPERLSTDLTSLGEAQEHLALVVELGVGADGTLTGSDVYRALVRNQAKLAYDAVAAWLDGKAPPPPRVLAVPGLDAQLRLQDEVAQRLRRLRSQRGALDLSTLQARAVFADGELTGLRREEKNRAKALIEDLMVAANGVVARTLKEKGFASFRRVLREPARWERIVALAAELSERLPLEPSAPALQGFLERRRQADPERFPDLSLSIVKLLGAGEYVVDAPGQSAPGHFGLAVQDYTHSTAPNRRFPDLLTQRMVKAALAGAAPPYDGEELTGLARHCTEGEKNAAKVERQVLKCAAALLLVNRLGARFDAVVTGASEKGTWVRIQEPLVEGKLVRGAHGLDVGDRARVELIHVDVEHGFIDFARAQEGR